MDGGEEEEGQLGTVHGGVGIKMGARMRPCKITGACERDDRDLGSQASDKGMTAPEVFRQVERDHLDGHAASGARVEIRR